MTPSISQQLRGIQRMLTDVVAPEVDDAYAAQALRGIIKDLAMLEAAWPKVSPFLRWDNARTLALLHRAVDDVDDPLRTAIEQLRPLDDEQPTEELERHNDELRDLLVRTIEQVVTAAPPRGLERDIRRHLVTRSERYPLRMAIAAPTRAD